MLSPATRSRLAALAVALAACTNTPSGPPSPSQERPGLTAAGVHVSLGARSFRVSEGTRTILDGTGASTRLAGGSAHVRALQPLARKGAELTARLWLEGGDVPGLLRLRFFGPGILEVELAFEGAAAVGDDFADQGEHYYGVWEHVPNTRIALADDGAQAPYLGDTAVNELRYASARSPFFLSDHGYAIYVASEALGEFHLGASGRTGFSFAGPRLTYFVLLGGYGPELAGFARLAGGGRVPPDWALDPIWWRDDYHGAYHGTATDAQGNVLDDAKQLAANHIPAGAILVDRPYGTGAEGWGNFDFDAGFPDPPGMIRSLNQSGLRLLLWIANRGWQGLGRDAASAGYLLPGEGGPAVDMTNPAAYSWFQGRLDSFVRLGVSGYKIDRGEEGEMPDAVQNQQVRLFGELAAEGLTAQRGSDWYQFARNVTDGERRTTAVWEGDTYSTWEAMRASLLAGLRSGLAGFPLWGGDTGGYCCQEVGAELLARWSEMAAYTPMMLTPVGLRRTPWYDYDGKILDVVRTAAAVHHELIPYTRSELKHAQSTGWLVMRPLFLAFPGEPGLAAVEDEYMYGDGMLVAPVLQPGAGSRLVHLPAGTWYDGTGQAFRGPADVTAPAPLESTPVFFRQGAIIPRGDVVRTNDVWTPGWAPQLAVDVYPPAPGVQEDFQYFTGTRTLSIEARADRGSLLVVVPDLELPATIRVHLSAPGRIEAGGAPCPAATCTFDAARSVLSVRAAGATTIRLTGWARLG